jgi:hypothetical protein
VLSSVIAAQVAISFGIPLIAAGAVLTYLLAFTVIAKTARAGSKE